MTKPLALIGYENLLPGTQLVNRLQDLGYRVQALTSLAELPVQAEQSKPIVVLLDLAAHNVDGCQLIAQLKNNPATAHIPILAYTRPHDTKRQTAARKAGATLVASDVAILAQLPLLLEQALEIE